MNSGRRTRDLEGAKILISVIALLALSYLLLREDISWLHIALETSLLFVLLAVPISRNAVGRLVQKLPLAGMARVPQVQTLIILYAFSGWPFFWYSNQIAGLFQRLVLLGIAVVYLLQRREWKANTFNICMFVFLVLSALSTAFSSLPDIQSRLFTRIILYVFLFAMITVSLSMDWGELKKAANKIIFIYLCISLPSVLILAAFVLDVGLPYININLGGRGDLYRLYPFGIVADNTIFSLGDGISIVRLNGFSEEPGVLGTYTVFFILLNRLVGDSGSKGRRELLLHVLGALSLSLFYFGSAGLLLLIKLIEVLKRAGLDVLEIMTKGWQFETSRLRSSMSSISLLLLIACSIAVAFTLIQPGNPLYYLTIARFLPDESGALRGDSRSVFLEATLDYIRYVDWPRLLLGNGPGSNSLDGPGFGSWAAELYDVGIIALCAIFVLYGYILLRSAFYRGVFNITYPLLIAPAVLSFYQRPETISPIMLVFWVIVFRYFTAASNPLCNRAAVTFSR